MSEVILNLLPLSDAHRAAFLAAAPEAEHIFAPAFGAFGPPRSPTREELGRATIILGNPPAADLAHAPKLCWLQTWSAGVEQFLEPGVLPESAVLTSAAGAYDQTVAEHLLSMALALCRKLHLYRDNQAADRWKSMGRVKSVRGATILIVGAGRIGCAFGQLCQALGGETVGLRRTPGEPPPGLDRLAPMEELELWLPRADITALVLPHTPETAHIMDARRLALLKEDSILLNAGRGSAIDLDALLPLVRSRRLFGVGLDVTEPEPLPPGHPLWGEPSVLLTPHVAGGFYLSSALEQVIHIALDNLARYLSGHPLNNLF